MLFFVSIVPYTSIFSICSHSYVPYASIEIILFPCWFMHIFCSSCFHMFPICFILFPDASDRISVSMKFPYVCHYHVFPLCLPYFIGLVKGNNYRKALYVMVKTMVSCKFSFKPIQWICVRHFALSLPWNVSLQVQPEELVEDLSPSPSPGSVTPEKEKAPRFFLGVKSYNVGPPSYKLVYKPHELELQVS